MDLKNFEQFALEFTTLSNEPEIDIKISPLSAWCLIAQLQLALRHPENTGLVAQHARDVATALQSRIPLSEGMRSIMDMGWSKEYDATVSETLENFLNRVPQREIVEVHNAYALYQSEDEREGMIQTSRPQDWANKSQWAYERFKFEWLDKEKHYINNAYCWYNPSDLEKWEVPRTFAGAIAMILMPGSEEKLCGNCYLDEEDFWCDDWGVKPPVYVSDYGDVYEPPDELV